MTAKASKSLTYCLAILCVVGLPVIAHAANTSNSALRDILDLSGLKPTYQIIFNDQNLAFWQFFRSLVNYGLVITLVLAAFANVLRLNLDNYSVKRVLPGLITGFIGANLSIYICQLVLQLSESVYKTLQQLGGTGGVANVLTSKFETAIFGLVAFLATALFTTGPGIILGALAAIGFILIPIIIEFLMLGLFIVRNFVIQFLVGVSPVFFLAMGLPFAQGWFKKWWQQFTVWAFMKPVAFFFLALGAIIINTGIGGHLVSFIVGIGVMVMALTVPFKSGGWINAAVKSYTKQFGGGVATWTRGVGANLAESKNPTIAGAGRRMVGLTELPSSFKKARERRESNIESMGQLEAAKMRGDKAMITKLEDGNVSDYADKYKDLSVEELGVKMANASSDYERAAIMKLAGDKGQRVNMYKAYNKHASTDKKISDEELANPQLLKEREAKLMGAQIVEKEITFTNDKGETETKSMKVIDGGLAQRYGNRFDEADRKNGIAHLGFRQQTVVDTGGQVHQIVSEKEDADKAGSNLFSGAAITVNRNLTSKTATVDGKLSGAFLKAIESGKYNRESVKGSKDENMNTDFLSTVQANWASNADLLTKLETSLKEDAGKAKTDAERRDLLERATVAAAVRTRFNPNERDAYNAADAFLKASATTPAAGSPTTPSPTPGAPTA